jgi:serine/threonine protein kinase
MMGADGYLAVIDMGFAKEVPYYDKGAADGVLHEMTYTLCGTPEYIAPETLLRVGHNKAVDYWAIGCLAYEMTHGQSPFQADTNEEVGVIFLVCIALRAKQSHLTSCPIAHRCTFFSGLSEYCSAQCREATDVGRGAGGR